MHGQYPLKKSVISNIKSFKIVLGEDRKPEKL